MSVERAGRKIKILVVDSSRIHAQLLAEALQQDLALDVSWCADAASEIITKPGHTIDVAVVSASLAGDPLLGFNVLRQLRASRQNLRGIMLLESIGRETVLEAFRAGARGIFARTDSVDMLRKCVHCVQAGEIWAKAEHMAFAVEAIAAAPVLRAVDANGFNLLSAREMEVVNSLAEGLTNREIAERMGLSQHTIKNYLFRIFEKLGVSSRIELLFMTLSQIGAPGSSGRYLTEREQPDFSDTLSRAGADEGHPLAHAMRARKFRDGIGVHRDVVTAYMWFLICQASCEDLSAEVAAEARELSAQLGPKQISEARSKAAAYLKKATRSVTDAGQNAIAQALACAVFCLSFGILGFF